MDPYKRFNFEGVLEEELKTIEKLRPESNRVPIESLGEETSAYSEAHAASLAGLAFSGGGIRSATFNLGVIQALAKVREKRRRSGKTGLLSRFDYLSTVSGGGYIGAWFSAWLHRDARENSRPADAEFLNEFQDKVSTRPCGFGPAETMTTKACEGASGFEGPPTTSGFPPLEHAAVRYLRRYTNYLTPRLGMSGDTLALVSLFLRNLVLVQLVLITLVAAVLLVPYLLASVSRLVLDPGPTFFADIHLDKGLLGVGLIVLLMVLFACRHQLGKTSDDYKTRRSKLRARWINAGLVLACALASWIIVVSAVAISDVKLDHIWRYVAIGAISYSLVFRPFSASNNYGEPSPRFPAIFVTLVAGIVFGLMGFLCAILLNRPWAQLDSNLFGILTLGPPAVLLVISFIVTVHIGTARNLFSAMHREWWARMGGFVLYAIFAWTAIFAIAFYAPPLIRWLGNGGFAVLAAWIGASGAGAWIARSAESNNDGNKQSIARKALIRIAPRLFVLGMAILASFGVYLVMLMIAGVGEIWPSQVSLTAANYLSAKELTAVLTYSLSDSISWLHVRPALVAAPVAAIAFFVIARGFDINIFSLHSIYKNRLVRAYLGASRAGNREPDPFTGFDQGDDVVLAHLKMQRPIPILNATVNMTGGQDLAWQTRRAASFSFTPRFVGYETKSSQGEDLGGFRRTENYASGQDPGSKKGTANKGLTLGTVMAISGAAASPNMGYHTSPAVAALLTTFNLRLGIWAGNPGAPPDWRNQVDWESWWKVGPDLCVLPILSELTGSATAESAWVNLTDGGHFDNLGIYELVRRRCRLIVVTDAGCDPEHKFQDLANTVRKCWTDLGVHIFLPDLDRVALKSKKSRFCKAHGCWGVIEYPDRKRGQRERFGLILYLKCSLTKKEMSNYVDLRQYASVNIRFPHRTTADQFFDENQFEAYRHLGYCIAERYAPEIEQFFDARNGRLDTDLVFRKAKAIAARQPPGQKMDAPIEVSESDPLRVQTTSIMVFSETSD
jgi:hypothetical protein